MFSNTRHLRIEWGDCDPAGIVFYPRYFAMFDTSTTEMMEAAIGMSKFEYLKAFQFIGHPIVETRAIFRIPNRFGDRREWLAEPCRNKRQPEPLRIGHHIGEDRSHDALGERTAIRFFDMGAGMIDEMHVVDARRTRRHAGEA